MAQQVYPQLDMSGGVQSSTSHLLRKRNEVYSAKNTHFSLKIGAGTRRYGYEKVGETIAQGKDSLFGGVFNYGTNNKIIAGANNSADSAATLKYLDIGGYWNDIITDAAPNTRFQCLNYLDEYYVAGCSDNDTYLTLQNIDSTLTASTSRNVLNAPKAKFVTEFKGRVLAINVKIGNTTYKDRVYLSSNSLSITYLTRVQTNHKGLYQQLRVDSVKYLKPGMVVDIWGASSNEKKISSLTIISVDKNNNKISFALTDLDIKDNDELWLVDRHNQTNVYWNTDYPNPEEADFFKAPSNKETNPEFTGWGKNNNRLFLFTKNSFLKYDGANLITVSDTIGCVSHETIQNIGSWTFWLHTSGVWGYNDNTGNLKLISRPVENYVKAINQAIIHKASAVVHNRIYKLSIGELLDLTFDTTSTSTSSTSTSSTSSSTSSTSTSSTSTSSTSTSTSRTTTSTSSTSSSTSSTSSSTSSTSSSSTSSSTSTSTSSTSTSTVTSTKDVTRLCYDFDSNIWWPEKHKRELRFQFAHTMHGFTKPYFTDETGRLFRDETGNLDNGESIPMEIEFGRNNFGIDTRKAYLSVVVDSERSRGAKVMYSVDGGPFQTLGEINHDVETLIFPQKGQLVEGKDINCKVSINNKGYQPIINGLMFYYNSTESIPNESRL